MRRVCHFSFLLEFEPLGLKLDIMLAHQVAPKVGSQSRCRPVFGRPLNSLAGAKTIGARFNVAVYIFALLVMDEAS